MMFNATQVFVNYVCFIDVDLQKFTNYLLIKKLFELLVKILSRHKRF